MPSHEIHNLIEKAFLFNIREIVANEITPGNIAFDLAGFESVEIFIHTTDDVALGNFTLIIKHGDTTNPAEHTDADVSDLVGNTVIVAGQNDIASQGYVGKKRFISVDIQSLAITVGLTVGSFLVANTLRHIPGS